LQLLAIAIEQGLPAGDAVRRTLAGEKQPGPRDIASTGVSPQETAENARTAVAARPGASASAETSRAIVEAAAKQKADDLAFAPGPSPASTVSGVAAHSTADNADGGAARFVRPKTAQRRPPKIKDSAASVVTGPTPATASSGLMVEGDDNDSDDETKTDEEAIFGGRGSSLGEAGGQGKHTRDILGDRSGQAVVQEEEGGGIRLGKLKRATSTSTNSKGAYTAAEVESLRQAIQKLCSNTIPLGRSMDYLTEDIEDMKAELKTWRVEYKKRST
jgi:hypothetical protein